MVEEEFGASSTTQSAVRFTETLERNEPIYMAMGMTYDEYWNDDVDKARAYREAFQLKKRQINEQLWLQGLYVYKALERIFPLFNSWSEREVMPYVEDPIPLTPKEEKELKVTRERREMERMREYLESQIRTQAKQEE